MWTRSPICQWSVVSAAFATVATCLCAASIIAERSRTSSEVKAASAFASAVDCLRGAETFFEVVFLEREVVRSSRGIFLCCECFSARRR